MVLNSTSSSSVSLRPRKCTTPRRSSMTSQEDWGDVKQSQQSDVYGNSRYRVLSQEEQLREAERVERIIQDLKAQRRSKPRPTSARTSTRNSIAGSQRRISTDRTLAVEEVVEQHHGTETKRFVAYNKPKAMEYEQENGTSMTEIFQEQVFEQLQALRQAQRADLEAIQKLQREKESAERRARQLEEQLQLSGRHNKRREQSMKEIVVTRNESEDESAESDDNNSVDFGVFETGDAEALPPFDPEDRTEPNSPSDSVSGALLSSPEHSPLKWTPHAAKGKRNLLTRNDIATSAYVRIDIVYVDEGMESVSPVFTKRKLWSTDEEDKGNRSPVHRGRSRKDSLWNRTQSASRKTTGPEGSDDEIHMQPRRVRSISRSRSPSTTRRSINNIEGIRCSCAFFEEKEKAKAEEAQLAAKAAERLARAQRAQPPKQLIERQEQSKKKREEQMRQLEKEMNVEFSKQRRVRAREVPLSTYLVLSGDESGAVITAEEREQQRKERIRKRAQELLESSELPPRMSIAVSNTSAGNGGVAATIGRSQTASQTPAQAMSVKMKKKMAAAAEEEEQRRQRKPKPVPNFDKLHAQWEKILKAKLHAANNDSTTPNQTSSSQQKQFFSSRAAKIAELKANKEARKRRLMEKEEEARRQQKIDQEKLLQRTRASSTLSLGRGEPKPTKSEQLRVQKVLQDMIKAQKQQEEETIAAEVRGRKQRLATRRMTVQVKRSEEKRREEYTGNFVDLKEIEQTQKERAKANRQQFKEAIARNKEKLLVAVATRPSLMERFATDLKREEHKKNALETVVKNVFQNNLASMKGILTEEEEKIARDMVEAAESYEDD